MGNDHARNGPPGQGPHANRTGGLMGSLRHALAAASIEDDRVTGGVPGGGQAAGPILEPPPQARRPPSAADAVREARGDRHIEPDAPSTRLIRAHQQGAPSAAPRTKLVRGKVAVKRTDFFQDPVVGWLVVVGGPGLGAFRPIFEGNNTIGRGITQRVPIDFGDDTISAEEQAYIRYDSGERKFLLVPNLAKTNVVSVNDKKPTGAVELSAMDLITMGRTQLVFVPFCGAEFDWAELGDLKS